MTDLDFKTIGDKIKRRRKALGVTQEFIANGLDVNSSHISNIECGRSNPSLTVLVKIANLLTCSVDCFIGGEYTYRPESEKDGNVDNFIKEKLQYCDLEKKKKILKIIDLL